MFLWIKNSLKTKKGFGIVEVLIALGLLGLVSALVGNITLQTLKSSLTAETSNDISNLSFEIHSILGKEELCSKTFQNKDVELGLKDFSLDIPGTEKVLAPNFVYGRITITKVQLKVTQALSGTNNYLGELQVSYKKPEMALASFGDFKKSYSFYFLTNTATLPGKIKSCFGQQSVQGMCADMGGKFVAPSSGQLGFCDMGNISCTSIGGTWVSGTNGAAGTCKLEDKICAAMGGTWLNNRCQMLPASKCPQGQAFTGIN